MKTLHLLRHAKSSWDDAGLEDHDRPLSRRGRRDAAAMAAHVAATLPTLDLVLCSTARRSRETLEPILAAHTPKRVVLERGLYLARSVALLDQLRAIEERLRNVLLIGHNPGLHELALALADPRSVGALPPITGKFPTAALASFRIAMSWRRLAPGTAALAAYATPRTLAAAAGPAE